MTSEGWNKRQRVWRHNSFMGSARMMMAQCFAIGNSQTATPEAKETAGKISALAAQLAMQLKKRIDQ